MEEKIIEITVSPAKMFDMYLKGHGISYTWVAAYVDFTPTHISQVCGGKASLTENLRQKLNELLNTNY